MTTPYRVVLACSGGLDSSVAIRWLAERHGAEVVAATLDLGQGKDVLEEIRDRALAIGALRAHVVDVRDAYVRDHLVRGLKAGILCCGGASMAGPLAWPLIAQTLVEVARIEQAGAVAHGDRAGHDAAIEKTVRAVDSTLEVLAPAGEWHMTDAELVAYAGERHVLLPAPMIGGIAQKSARLPGEPAFVELGFDRGVPIAINGVVMNVPDLIASLDILAGAHGAAGGALAALHMAHAALQETAIAPEGRRFSTRVADEYVRELRGGGWFSPLRRALDAYVDAIEHDVRGVARLQLFEGECTIASCRLTVKPAAIALAQAARS
jgi:argininosuccinate synthase